MTATAADLATAVVVGGLVLLAGAGVWLRATHVELVNRTSHRRLMREIARHGDTTES